MITKMQILENVYILLPKSLSAVLQITFHVGVIALVSLI